MGQSKSKRAKWLLPVGAGLLFFVGFENGALQYVLLGVTSEFDLEGAAIGMLLATQYFALMIAQPLFGIIADRVGKKPMILVSMCIFIAGCIIIAGTPGISLFVAGVFITGMGYGVTEALISAALVDEYPDKAERYINISQSLFSFGAVVSPLAANQLSKIANARLIFLAAALGFVALLPFFTLIPLQRRHTTKEKVAFSFRNKQLLILPLLVIPIFIYGGMETSGAGFFNSLFSQALSTPEFGAYAISAFWLVMMASRLFFGVVRFPAKRVALSCMICGTAVFAALSISHSPLFSLLLCAIAGLGAGPVWAILISFAAKEVPAYSGTVVSFMTTSSGLGATLIPILVGWSANRFSLFAAMLTIGIVMLICVMVFMMYLKRRPD